MEDCPRRGEISDRGLLWRKRRLNDVDRYFPAWFHNLIMDDCF